MRHTTKQHGFVSILTVLFFMTILSVVTVGFTRFMIQEQRQQLEDELTKNAYNAALTGVEDAKRAMVYCATLTDVMAKQNCETQLYNDQCPGFNSTGYFYDALGIAQSESGKTSVTGEPAADAAQGYSCVIVTKNTESVDGQLSFVSGTGNMYELRTSSGTDTYDTARIYWQEQEPNGALLSLADYTSGNPRWPDWNKEIDGVTKTVPALLRATVISLPETGAFNLDDIAMKTAYIYPVSTGTTAAELGFESLPNRTVTRCDLSTPDSKGYRCYVDIKFSEQRHDRQYLVLHFLYRQAGYKVELLNADTDDTRLFGGVQPTIDSTGYTSGVSRRVIVGVQPGGQAINTSSAIDTAYGLCKSFRVGAPNTGSWFNEVAGQCTP